MNQSGKKIIRALTLWALLLAMALPAVPAGAAVRKVKNLTISAGAEKIAAKATAVSMGTTKLILSSGFMKFTAPADGTYRFRFRNIHLKKKTSLDYINGKVEFYGLENGYLKAKKVKTGGGSGFCLYLASRLMYEYQQKKSLAPVTYYTDLPARTGKLKMTKGQVIYLYAYFSRRITCTLRISS